MLYDTVTTNCSLKQERFIVCACRGCIGERLVSYLFLFFSILLKGFQCSCVQIHLFSSFLMLEKSVLNATVDRKCTATTITLFGPIRVFIRHLSSFLLCYSLHISFDALSEISHAEIACWDVICTVHGDPTRWLLWSLVRNYTNNFVDTHIYFCVFYMSSHKQCVFTIALPLSACPLSLGPQSTESCILYLRLYMCKKDLFVHV